MSKCKSCGKEWVDHCGTEITCRHLQTCVSALKVIHTWAAYDQEHGYKALIPDHVVELIERKFDEIGVNYAATTKGNPPKRS